MYLSKLKNLGLRSQFFLLAMSLVVSSVWGIISTPSPAHAAVGTISEYSVPNQWSDKRPGYLTVGPDNNIWYANALYYSRIDKLTTSGSFTQYNPTLSTGKYNAGITKGSDGNVWYAESYTVNSVGYGRIVSMTTNGALVGQYNIPSGKTVGAMTLGPDGNVWFTETDNNKIGKITPSGSITEYLVNVGGYAAQIFDITAGPDGNMWFTAGNSGSTHNAIGRITPSGTVTSYQISTYNALVYGITVGPDGNLWFTEAYSNKIGKITTAGVITEYSSIPTAGSRPQGITAGSDGSLWFAEYNTNKIGRITTSGIVTEYTVADAQAGSLDHIITGPDGAVWFSNSIAGKVGRIATELSNQTITFTSTAPTNAVIDGSVYAPSASASSGLSAAITVDSSSSDVCSIDGAGKVSFQGAGTCVLDANQAGNADYNPAVQVQQSFAVLPVNADTSVSLGCPATASVGSTVTCTITMANNGPAAATDASLTALFSDSFSGISLSGDGVVSGRYITWSVPSLASGASTTLTFSATASVAGKARFNAALLQTSPDPNNSDNIVNATIGIS